MPIYEYDCPDCGVIEVIQKITAEPLCECPYCLEHGAHRNITRRVSLTSFQLKGSGWYKTDYSNGSSSGKNGHGSSANGKNASTVKSDNNGDTTAKSETKTETSSTPTSKPAVGKPD